MIFEELCFYSYKLSPAPFCLSFEVYKIKKKTSACHVMKHKHLLNTNPLLTALPLIAVKHWHLKNPSVVIKKHSDYYFIFFFEEIFNIQMSCRLASLAPRHLFPLVYHFLNSSSLNSPLWNLVNQFLTIEILL